MGNTAVKKTKGSGFFSNLVRQQMFIPVAALVILAVFNLIAIRLSLRSHLDTVVPGHRSYPVI